MSARSSEFGDDSRIDSQSAQDRPRHVAWKLRSSEFPVVIWIRRVASTRNWFYLVNQAVRAWLLDLLVISSTRAWWAWPKQSAKFDVWSSVQPECGGLRDVSQPPPQSQSKGCWSVLQLWIYQNVWLKVVVSLSSTSKWEWRRVYELESVLSCLCTDCHWSSPLLQSIWAVSPLFDIYHPHTARYIFPLLLALSPILITWVCPKTRYPQIWFIILSHVIMISILIKIAIADHKCWVYVVYTIFRHTLLSIIWYPR